MSLVDVGAKVLLKAANSGALLGLSARPSGGSILTVILYLPLGVTSLHTNVLSALLNTAEQLFSPLASGTKMICTISVSATFSSLGNSTVPVTVAVLFPHPGTRRRPRP